MPIRYSPPEPSPTASPSTTQLPDQQQAQRYRLNQTPNAAPSQVTVSPAGLPVQFRMNRSEWTNPALQSELTKRGAQIYAGSLIDNFGISLNKTSTTPGFTYWENPQRVARYYNVLRSLPPGQSAPDWLDAEGIKAAYSYLSARNNGADWMSW